MSNAKEEILSHLEKYGLEKDDIVYIKIRIEPSEFTSTVPNKFIEIEVKGELTEELLNELNFDYSNGYGRQELFGYIWYKDGTWSERWEYDGVEGWDYKKVPDKTVDV